MTELKELGRFKDQSTEWVLATSMSQPQLYLSGGMLDWQPLDYIFFDFIRRKSDAPRGKLSDKLDLGMSKLSAWIMSVIDKICKALPPIDHKTEWIRETFENPNVRFRIAETLAYNPEVLEICMRCGRPGRDRFHFGNDLHLVRGCYSASFPYKEGEIAELWNSSISRSAIFAAVEKHPAKVSKAQMIRDHMRANPTAKDVDIVKALAAKSIKVYQGQVSLIRRAEREKLAESL